VKNRGYLHKVRTLFRPPPIWLTCLLVLLFLGQNVTLGTAAGREAASPPSVRQISLPPEFLAKGVFLVAGRQLRDARFSKAVILLVQYDRKGAMGIIINHPTESRLATLLPQESLLRQRNDLVYFGGPVENHHLLLLIRSDIQPDNALPVLDGIFASSSPAVLRNLLQDPGQARQFRAYAGYTGWSGGQLEREIARGDWHLMPAEPELIFSRDPGTVWPDLIRRAAHIWTRNLPPAEMTAPLAVPDTKGIGQTYTSVRRAE
jgi:putative transcriptional regulator